MSVIHKKTPTYVLTLFHIQLISINIIYLQMSILFCTFVSRKERYTKVKPFKHKKHEYVFNKERKRVFIGTYRQVNRQVFHYSRRLDCEQPSNEDTLGDPQKVKI